MYNPHAQRVTELSNKLETIARQIQQIGKDAAWYPQFSIDDASQQIQGLGARIQQRKERVSLLEAQLSAAKRTLPALREKGAYGFNPTKWFSKEKQNARQQAAECEKAMNSLATQLVNAAKAVTIDSQQRDDLVQQVEKYRTYDEARERIRLAELHAEHTRVMDELHRVKEQHDRVQAVLAPQLADLSDLERQAKELAGKVSKAAQLDRDLSSASNPRDRALIHEESERAFGDGRPGKVMGRLNRELEGVKRNIEKLEHRLKRIGTDASRDIRKVVFDGSNLCIINGTYIGLSALRPAVRAVAKRAKTVVVFDASMRRRFNVADHEFTTLFGPDVTVHVAPGEADETVLDLADDPTAFVVSNDRFADYKDKAAVRQGRVIPHQVVDGKVFLRGGLDVAETMEQEA